MAGFSVVNRAPLVAAAALALVAAGRQAQAHPRAGDTPHGLVRFRSFGSAEGLHNLVVNTIAQDATGALWIGTDGGIARYDGERFTQIGPKEGLASTVLNVVGTAPDGNVCVGGATGLACWDGVRFQARAGAGLPDVRSLASAHNRLWIGTAQGLYVREHGAEHGAEDGGKIQRAPGWPGRGFVKALWADASGVIASDGGRVFSSAGDAAWTELSSIGLAGDRIDGIVRDRKGTLWIRSARHLWRLDRDAPAAEDLSAGLPPGYDSVNSPISIVLGPHDEILVACDRGIALRDGEQWRIIDRSAGLPSLGARTLFVDRDGATWVASIGLFQERGGGLLERYDLAAGLPGDVAWSITRDRDQALWVGTNRCLARLLGGKWSCLPGSENRIVRSFVLAPQGGVFLGGAPSDLMYIDAAGRAISLGQELGNDAEHTIFSMKLGPEGDLWVATRAGLYRLPGAVPGPLVRETIPGIPVDVKHNTLLVANGVLWTASTHGIALHDAGAWHVFGARDGLLGNAMRYLTHTRDREYCVTYLEAIGVSCFELDGHAIKSLRHIGVADGMITGSVYFLGADRQRRLWIGTGNGVDVVTPEGIDHFGELDGLAGNDAAANAFYLDVDGAVWLGSTGGVTWLDAERYQGPPPPPSVVVRDGELGDKKIGQSAAGRLETAHSRNALRVAFGPNRMLDAERVEFQVRLSPLETAWSTTRLREARYPSLLAGGYQFEARARIGGGAWGPTTVLAFRVLPAWWQSRWFFALVGAGVLLAVAGGFAWLYRTTLQRRTRQLHERSAASMRALLELVPDLISVHQDGEVIYTNRAARRFYGITGDGVRPDLGDRIHPDDRARLAEVMATAVAVRTGDDSTGDDREPDMVELRVRGDDGGWRICEISVVAMELAGDHVLVASGRDVTERRQLRAQLLVSDRMASLGTLAAGIAHEINNPLAYVLGNLEVIAETVASPEPRKDQLATAVSDATDGAQRVKKIVQGLRSFSRSEEEKRVPLALADVLGAATRLTANEVRHRAQLVCEFGPAPRVVADDGRLTQVFINLIVNAAHAIPEGKSDDNRITVRTTTGEHGRAVVEIVDTGRGMPPDVLARAFDPFFTTKDVGSGTGLGLSICHGIITALDGQIELESAVGRGTTVRVSLPPAPVAAIAAVVPIAAPAPAPASRSRVMVVDDEPLVAEMLERMLRRDHDVVAVTCGTAALDHVRSGTWFDAIVSDVMMPNMTGIELLEAIVELAPEQAKRLIFLSGGVFTPATRARLDELGTVQLEKPISTKDLRRSVMTVATAQLGAAREAAH